MTKKTTVFNENNKNLNMHVFWSQDLSVLG